MNSIAFKLRRYRYTVQQWFMTPIHRYIFGRRIVHFIHVSKTGGTSVKMALMSFGCKTKTHYFCLHGHRFTLRDVPKKDIAIITLRDGKERQMSIAHETKPDAHKPQHWYWCNHPHSLTYVLHTEQLTEEFEILKQVFGIPLSVYCGHINKGTYHV